jgi:hypothetical protein
VPEAGAPVAVSCAQKTGSFALEIEPSGKTPIIRTIRRRQPSSRNKV